MSVDEEVELELVDVEAGGGVEAFSIRVQPWCSRFERAVADGVAVYVRGEGEPFRLLRLDRFGEISEEEVLEGMPWLRSAIEDEVIDHRDR